MKCAGHSLGIASDIEAHRLQNSGDDVADVSGDDIAAGVRDSFAPLIGVLGGECLPVRLKNTYTGFPLVDVFAVTKCDFHACPQIEDRFEHGCTFVKPVEFSVACRIG